MPKVHEFPLVAGGIFLETLIPTQRVHPDFDPEPFNFQVQHLVEILKSIGFVQLRGIYPDDETAAADGVELGEIYELSDNNIWNVPGGLFKRRTYVP